MGLLGMLLPLLLLLVAAHQAAAVLVPLRYSRQPAPTPLSSPSSLGSSDKAMASNNGSSTHLANFVPFFYAYFAQLSFQGQIIDVLIDTGSHDLLIPTTLCSDCAADVVSQRLDLGAAGAALVGCDDAACRGQCTPQLLAEYGFLDQQDGAQAVCGLHGGVCSEPGGRCLFLDYYADRSHASGVLVTSETVGFAGMAVKNVTFGAIDSASDSFFEAPQGGGIMGMAFRTREGEAQCWDTPCFEPLLDVLVAQEKAAGGGGGMKDSFAVYGHPSAPIMFVGESSVGPEAKGYYEGELAYVPLQQPYGLYLVEVGGMSFLDGQEKKEGAESFLPGVGPGIGVVDTGATGMFFPVDVFERLKAYFQTHYCHVAFICGPEPTPPPPPPPPPLAPPLVTQPQKQQQQQQHAHNHTTTRFLRRHHHTQEKEEKEPHPTIFDFDIWAKYDEATLALLPTLVIHLSGGERGGKGVEVKLTPTQYLTQHRFEDDGEVYYTFGISTLGGRREEEEEEEEGGSTTSEARLRRKYRKAAAGGKSVLDEVFIFGELLLNHYFVHFDREGRRLGFAPAVLQAPGGGGGGEGEGEGSN